MLAEYAEKCSLIDKTINVVWVRVVSLYQTAILTLLKRYLRLSYSRQEGRSSIFTALPTPIPRSTSPTLCPYPPTGASSGGSGAQMTGNYKSARGPSTAAVFEKPVLTGGFTTSLLLLMAYSSGA